MFLLHTDMIPELPEPVNFYYYYYHIYIGLTNHHRLHNLKTQYINTTWAEGIQLIENGNPL
jgi:hypothetical protein